MKKKFSRSLSLNKKSVASLSNKAQRRVVGGNDDKTNYETCEINCIPETVYPTCEDTCHTDCNCTGAFCYTGDQGWGACS
ncbi:class I lanthipeptide [Kordia algicida OT-1]|uniref:Uncharacterized protein n=1 Tax=Kordia algicida OT-1 TaxID=391587 RepID=A9DWL4_9FLAO|nr:class I lanthipeptide [Kordia algicida]EDP95916.1 hypothetical protein KAOT1_07103 [Kordia algicida OT-1]